MPPTCPRLARDTVDRTTNRGAVEEPTLANRDFGEVYQLRKDRADLHAFLLEAVEASGGRVLYTSDSAYAPVYLGVQLASDERIGLLVYPFRITQRSTRNRPANEIRGQLRYGGEKSWKRDHPVGRDIAGVDVTMIVGIDLEHQIMLGLDALLWDPLPMGISFYAKVEDIERAQASTWYVWEKVNRGGKKREESRSPSRLETFVAFTPARFIDYARLERRATSLRLDPALRFATATAMAESNDIQEHGGRHVLEEQFELSSAEILSIIGGRNRLQVAVRGGVAEHHLERQLGDDRRFALVKRLDADAMHDFNVIATDGSEARVECKNASPKTSRRGEFKVEVQKTRASKGDPASRFYRIDAFDVVAACLFSATGKWEFRYGRTSDMKPHPQYPDRLAPIQTITAAWTSDLHSLLSGRSRTESPH